MNFVSICRLPGKCATQKLNNLCSSSLWTCLYNMVIFKSQNKIIAFSVILAWLCRFYWLPSNLKRQDDHHLISSKSIQQFQNCIFTRPWGYKADLRKLCLTLLVVLCSIRRRWFSNFVNHSRQQIYHTIFCSFAYILVHNIWLPLPDKVSKLKLALAMPWASNAGISCVFLIHKYSTYYAGVRHPDDIV